MRNISDILAKYFSETGRRPADTWGSGVWLDPETFDQNIQRFDQNYQGFDQNYHGVTIIYQHIQGFDQKGQALLHSKAKVNLARMRLK